MSDITVLMPVFNTSANWLSQSVESVLNQTYKDFKFLIIDDGSTNEDTLSYLKALKKTDSRITIVRNPQNIGLVATLNRGIALCDTKWIARMDADDICLKNRLEKQIHFLHTHPNTIVLGSNAKIIETGRMYSRKVIPQTRKEVEATLPFFCCFVHPAIIFNREEIAKLGGYPNVPRAEDYALWLKVLFETNKEIENLPDVLMWIRKGLDNKPSYRTKIDSSGLTIHSYIAEKLHYEKLPAFWDDNEKDLKIKLRDFPLIRKAVIKRFPNVSIPHLDKEIIKLKLKVIKKFKTSNNFWLFFQIIKLQAELFLKELQIYIVK